MKFVVKLVIACFAALTLGFVVSSPAAGDPDEDLYDKTYELVKKKLATPYKKKFKLVFDEDGFSRCPSGIRGAVDEVAEVETAYSYGMLMKYDGCQSEEICRYRARLSDKKVEVLQGGKSEKYISVDAWLSTATASLK